MYLVLTYLVETLNDLLHKVAALKLKYVCLVFTNEQDLYITILYTESLTRKVDLWSFLQLNFLTQIFFVRENKAFFQILWKST